jgi:hypothetical protein
MVVLFGNRNTEKSSPGLDSAPKTSQVQKGSIPAAKIQNFIWLRPSWGRW